MRKIKISDFINFSYQEDLATKKKVAVIEVPDDVVITAIGDEGDLIITGQTV